MLSTCSTLKVKKYLISQKWSLDAILPTRSLSSFAYNHKALIVFCYASLRYLVPLVQIQLPDKNSSCRYHTRSLAFSMNKRNTTPFNIDHLQKLQKGTHNSVSFN